MLRWTIKAKNEILRRTSPIFRPVTFLVAFRVVLVAPRTGRCLTVSCKSRARWRSPRQHNHNDGLAWSSRRADDITRERRHESLGQIRHNRTSMIVSYTPARRGLLLRSILLVTLLTIPFFDKGKKKVKKGWSNRSSNRRPWSEDEVVTKATRLSRTYPPGHCSR